MRLTSVSRDYFPLPRHLYGIIPRAFPVHLHGPHKIVRNNGPRTFEPRMSAIPR